MKTKKEQDQEPFGGYVRRLREERTISLRQFAKDIEMHPAYLSKIERGDFPPPAEEKVIAIAKGLQIDSDVLLAKAGKVSSDLLELIKRRPTQMGKLIRSAAKLPVAEVEAWMEQLPESKRRPRK